MERPTPRKTYVELCVLFFIHGMAMGAWFALVAALWLGFGLPDKEMDTMLQLNASATRRRGIRGLAARDGKLYMSINAGANWLENATSPSDVDIEKCEPRYAQPDCRGKQSTERRLGSAQAGENWKVDPPGGEPANGHRRHHLIALQVQKVRDGD